MRPLILGALALMAPLASHAFCGTYVGEPGAELTSGASQVVLARQGTRTTLTLANDVEASVKDFAIVIPVPEVLDEDDVRVVDASFIDQIQRYAGPRLVTYECADFAYLDEWGRGSSGCGGCNADDAFYALDSAETDADPPSVTVEAEFAVGEYDIVILSSEDSADLLTWLNNEGYGVSEAAESMLGEYIAADSKFMAAKVRLDDVPVADGIVGRPYLTPLQISYDSDTFSLPIRLGTVNSPGTQDLIVYALTDVNEGEVSISNYPQAELATDCMFDEARHGDMDDFIGDQIDAAVDANDGAAWVRTYSWTGGWCDPCPDGQQLDDATVTELGFEGGAGAVHTTRLWMRYDADAAAEDVVLYTTGGGAAAQLRYIVYADYLEDRFPICLEGMAENPGTCPDDSARTRTSSLGGWPLFGFVGLLGGLGLALRRRQR